LVRRLRGRLVLLLSKTDPGQEKSDGKLSAHGLSVTEIAIVDAWNYRLKTCEFVLLPCVGRHKTSRTFIPKESAA
jgi:hypothetical protein